MISSHSNPTGNRPNLLRRAASAAGLLLGLAAAAVAQAPSPAQPPSYVLQPGSALWITGDSTLHAWGSTATKVELSATFASPQPSSGDVAKGALRSLKLSLPVQGLKSGESGLDKNTYKALKEPKAPAISFTLLDYSTATAKDGSLRVLARGKLSIAGAEKETVVEGTCRFAGDAISVSGSHELLMTDFGVTPPTLMFGAIKVANKIVVHFDLMLKASSNATPAK